MVRTLPLINPPGFHNYFTDRGDIMSSDYDLTELFNELSLAHGCDLDAIKDVLEQQGIIDPSKSLIKKLLANVESKRCCRCHYVAADQNKLVTHLKKRS